MRDKQLLDAFQHWEELDLTDSEYFALLSRYKRMKDEEAVIIEAELRIEKAREKGFEQGIEQGREIGRQQSLRQMIINFIENEFSDEMIAKFTKQSIEKVQAIRESM